jgi:hypothetical protein
MRILKNIFITALLVLLLTSFSLTRIDYSHGIQNNVCKSLKDKVLVYFVFVDTKETAPWTEFDIRSTLDSMQVALNWIENQARKKSVNLNIHSDYYIGNDYATIRKNLPFGTVLETATTPNVRKGIIEINKWADAIAARIGKEFQISPRDGIPEIKNPNNTERLIAHLRDENQVESVVLLFMVNNYYRNDISLTVNHLSSDNVEFAIVSYKYPSIIAQNILTLFGASDLYKTFYRKNDKSIKLASEFFPNDIMQDAYGKSVNGFEIDELTSYLIGWTNNLDSKYNVLLTDKVVGF